MPPSRSATRPIESARRGVGAAATGPGRTRPLRRRCPLGKAAASIALSALAAWSGEPPRRPSPVALVRGSLAERQDPGGEGPAAARAFAVVAKGLERSCVPFDAICDEDVEAGALEGKRVAVLAYNPRLGPAERAALLRFVGSGGKLVVFYAADPSLWPALGVRAARVRARRRSGEFAEIRFRKRLFPFAPESVMQDSWNVLEVAPAAGAKVLASWRDERALPTECSPDLRGEASSDGVPAVVEGPGGVLVTHVLLGPLTEAKSRMLLAIVAALAQAPVMEPAARGRLRIARDIPFWYGLGGLASLVRALEDPRADREGIARALAEGERAERDALAALEVGSAAEALAQAFLAERASREAAARAVPARDGEIRAIWVRYPEQVDWASVAPTLARAGFNAVLPNYVRGLRAAYGSRALAPARGGEQRGSLESCLRECRRAGLEVHIWWTVLFLDDTPAERQEELARAQRLVVDATGAAFRKSGAGWLCPSAPENLALLRAAARELSGEFAPDGLHLDYARLPSEESCYCAACARASRIEGNWPEQVLPGGGRWGEFRAFRRSAVTAAVEAIARAAREARPQICISAAVFPEPAVSRETIAQDWPAWVDGGLLDFVVPMDYTSSCEELARWVREQSRRVAGRIPLVPGLGVAAGRVTLDDPADLLRQILVARESGADGFAIFQLDPEFVERHLPLVAAGPGRTGASVRPHGAPALEWRLGDGTAGGAVAAGSALEVALTVGSRLPTGLPVTRFGMDALAGRPWPRLELESACGRTLAELGPGPGPGGRASIPFRAPEGPFRIALRGAVEAPPRAERLVTVRSPLFVGRTEAERGSELSRSAPVGSGARVAVLDGGYGSRGILACLRRRGDFAAYPIASLAELGGAGGVRPAVLVLTQRRDPGELDDAARAAVRLFVEAGGGVLLTHDACGYRYHPMLFSEIVRSCRTHERESAVTAEPGSLLERELGPEPVEHSHYDHVVIEPGEAGSVAARGRAGPVVVWGETGRGRVVACGIALGIDRDERDSAPEGREAELLSAMIRYLARIEPAAAGKRAD